MRYSRHPDSFTRNLDNGRAVTTPVVRFTVKGSNVPADAPTVGSPGRRYALVYDGYCNVCKKLVAALSRWDRLHQLEILPSQTPGIAASLKSEYGFDVNFERAKHLLEENDGAGNTFKATAKPVL